MATGTLILLLMTTCLGLLAVGYGLVGSTHKRRLQREFNALADTYQLRISSQEIFNRRILGIDCNARRVLYVQVKALRVASIVIDLDDVMNCAYRKVYRPASRSSATQEANLLLTGILLELDTKDLATVSIPIYHALLDSRLNPELLEKKAKNWEVMIQKLTGQMTTAFVSN